MSRRIELPEEVFDALGPEPERAALEAILLSLIARGRISVARAGEILRLDRVSAIRWYTSHGFYYPDLSGEDVVDELRYAAKGGTTERPRERRTTRYDVTNYYDPETGEVRSGAPDFFGDRVSDVEPEEGGPVSEE